jgi:hypothetical protein
VHDPLPIYGKPCTVMRRTPPTLERALHID